VRYYSSLPAPPQSSKGTTAAAAAADSDEEWSRLRHMADEKKRELEAFFASQSFTVPSAYSAPASAAPASFAARVSSLRTQAPPNPFSSHPSHASSAAASSSASFVPASIHPPPPAPSRRLLERPTAPQQRPANSAETDFFASFPFPSTAAGQQKAGSGGSAGASTGAGASAGNQHKLADGGGGDDAWLYDVLSSELRAKIKMPGRGDGTASGALLPAKLTDEQKYNIFAGETPDTHTHTRHPTPSSSDRSVDRLVGWLVWFQVWTKRLCKT
jgi:hypothetical protein